MVQGSPIQPDGRLIVPAERDGIVEPLEVSVNPCGERGEGGDHLGRRVMPALEVIGRGQRVGEQIDELQAELMDEAEQILVSRVDEFAAQFNGPSWSNQVRGRAHPSAQPGLCRVNRRPQAGLRERVGRIQPGDSTAHDGDPGSSPGRSTRSRGWLASGVALACGEAASARPRPVRPGRGRGDGSRSRDRPRWPSQPAHPPAASPVASPAAPGSWPAAAKRTGEIVIRTFPAGASGPYCSSWNSPFFASTDRDPGSSP